MADLDDDAITVTLPAEEGGAVIEKVVPEKVTPAADDPISDLKGQFEQLKGTLNHRDQQIHLANQQLVEKDKELAEVRKEVVTSQLDTVTTGIQAAEADASSAEQEFIAAAEKGDFAAQARAQRKISAAESHIQRLKEAEGDLKDQAATKPAARQESRPEPRQQQSDPVEAVASTLSPKSAAWIRAHPDCITDRKKNARMLAAHNMALADDVEVDSKDYFARIEAAIEPAAAKVEPKVNIRPSAPVAPAGNSAGGMNGGGMTVTLTKREAEAATDGSLVYNYNDPAGKFKKGDVIGVQEMARRKMIMQKQGLYDKTFSE